MERVFVKDGENFETMPMREFNLEKPLEKIIIEFPELVPIDEIFTHAKLFPISTQTDTTHGTLDVLGIDQEGNLFIIETKLYKNSEDRRKIHSQVVDYAAGLMSLEQFDLFKDAITNANQGKGAKGTKLENMTLEDIVSNMPENENVLKKIEKNFLNSNYCYIVILDKLDSRLKELIQLHNKKDDNPLYAVTISNYVIDDSKNQIIISSVFGTESAKPSQSKRNRKKWEVEGFDVFVKNLQENKSVENSVKLTVNEFVQELKNMLGDEPYSNDCDIGYFSWGGGLEPRFFSHFYSMGHKDWEIRSAFSIDADGSIRIRYISRSGKYDEFTKKFTDELRKIPCSKNLLNKIDSGNLEPLWHVSEWTPCKNELMKIIKKICVPAPDFR